MISHDYNLLSSCDRIIHLDQSRIKKKMTNNEKKKILIIINSDLYVRNYLQTGIFQIFQKSYEIYYLEILKLKIKNI